MKQYPIVNEVSSLLTPFILLFALYVQFHGDFGPGGGFQAGVIFSAGLILYILVHGIDKLKEVIPLRFVIFMAVFGVLLYGGVGVATMILGGNFLDYNQLNPHHPQHGQHLGLLLIELGVGITVNAAMLAIFYAITERYFQQSTEGEK